MTVTPAQAADQAIMLSADGTNFARTIPGPLFDSSFRIVPGDKIERIIWLRNDGSTAGRLRFDLIKASSTDPQLAAHLELAARPEPVAGAGSSSTISRAGKCVVLRHSLRLNAGETVKLRVSAKLGNLSGQQGQRARATFSFRAVLTDAAAPAPADAATCALATGDDAVDIPGTGDDPEGQGGLPITGAGAVGRFTAAGAGMILAGALIAALAAWRRRRKEETA
ncbi:hypothetical protein [Rarobacter faecitabidus]|nr:hypothetical protein [Rarobacter faecitabidus]